MKNEVENFINKFKYLHPQEVEDVFLYGDCYYFARILASRFPQAIIKYMIIKNHFITEIDGRYWDVRGDITDILEKDEIVIWHEYKNIDPLHYNRIVRDCINF